MMYKDRLKQIRERLGIKQVDIANMLNVSKACYCQYEQQKDIMPLKHLILVANYLNVSLDFLFDFTDINQYNINNNIELKKVGFRLKELRKTNNLTQAKLAENLNIAKSMIGAYEHGDFLISTHALYTLCKTYKISADYLLGKIDKPKYLK